jgi:Zinc finger, C3HC4 type (RING finger)
MSTTRGFRDCSICLEPLYQLCEVVDNENDHAVAAESLPSPPPPQRKMTFIVPCGHAFHTDCFRNWNQSRIGQERWPPLQCATCNGSIKDSYYVVKDYTCAVCRLSLYQSQHQVMFTLPDHCLVHSECWTLFQRHGKAKLLWNRADTQAAARGPFWWRCWGSPMSSTMARTTTQSVSFRGLPITQTHKVFLFQDQNASAADNDWTRQLRDWAATLAAPHIATTDKLAALDRLLFHGAHALPLDIVSAAKPPNANDGATDVLLHDIVTLSTVCRDIDQCPIRSTAVAAMAEFVIPAIFQALEPLALPRQDCASPLWDNHDDDTLYRQCCILLALMCWNDVGYCQMAVTSGAFVRMLFGVSNKVSSKLDPTEWFGLQVALTAFVQCANETMIAADPPKQTTIPVVAAGIVPALLEAMQAQADQVHIQWLGLEFLAALHDASASASSSPRVSWWWRYESEPPNVTRNGIQQGFAWYQTLAHRYRDCACVVELAEILQGRPKITTPYQKNQTFYNGQSDGTSMFSGSETNETEEAFLVDEECSL